MPYYANLHHEYHELIDETTDGYIGLLPQDIKNEIKKYLNETFVYDSREMNEKNIDIKRWVQVIESSLKDEIKIWINGNLYTIKWHYRYGRCKDMLVVFLLRGDKDYILGFDNFEGVINERRKIHWHPEFTEIRMYFDYSERFKAKYKWIVRPIIAFMYVILGLKMIGYNVRMYVA